MPRSPGDDQSHRMRQYVITMVVRSICFVLMFAIQPWGWHTAALAIGAIFLPYVAVVIANQAQAAPTTTAERPEIALAEAPEQPAESDEPAVIRIDESPREGQA